MTDQNTSPPTMSEDRIKEIASEFGGIRDAVPYARAIEREVRDSLAGCAPKLELDDHSRMSDDMRSYIVGMSVSVDVSTGDDDLGHRYMGTVTEVMDDRFDKHGVTLLVQDAKPNFTRPMPADLPVQQESLDVTEADVWHEGSRSFYRAKLLHRLTPEAAFSEPPEIAYPSTSNPTWKGLVSAGFLLHWPAPGGSREIIWSDSRVSGDVIGCPVTPVFKFADTASSSPTPLPATPPNDGRGTDAQIERERDIARYAIVGAIAAGYSGQAHPGAAHWLAAAHDAGVQIKQLEIQLANLTRQSTAPSPNPAGEDDSDMLDWLSNQVVDVRTPLRYGSQACFIGSPEDNDGESVPWNIREAIRSARAKAER